MNAITTLKNGLRIVTNTIPSSKSIAIAISIGAGGRYEDIEKNGGVSHFVEHLLFKGSKKRPTSKKISETIDRVGGYINAYTTEDHTCYYVKLPKKHLHLGFDVLADIIINPLFKHEEIERERGVIIEEMNVYRDDPARYVGDFTGELLWPHSPLRTNVIGKESVIKSITKKQIITYYKKLYAPNNIVVSVSGNIKHDEIAKMVRSKFSRLKNQAKTRFAQAKGPLSANKSKLLSNKTNQTHFILCCKAPKLDSKENIVFSLISTILGKGMSSRLFLSVRERKGLAYTVNADNHGFLETGRFEIYAGVKIDKVPMAIRAIMLEVKKISNKLVSGRELDKAKEQIKGQLIMAQEDNENIASTFAGQLILMNKIVSFDEMINRVDRISSEDILRVTKKYFRPNGFRLAIIGPYDENDQKELEKLIVLKG